MIVCSSLWFASALDKRERTERERDLQQEREEEEARNPRPRPPVPDPKSLRIYPFVNITISSPCALCGQAGNDSRGPKLPKACNDIQCPAYKKEHLHVECVSCKGNYYMATKTKL